jgi:hypothetical protein
MDLLDASGRLPDGPGRRARIAWLAVLLLAGACLLFEPGAGGPRGPRFNHALHGEETGLECTSCHRGADAADLAGMPSSKQCQLCHKDLDEGRPPEKQAAYFFEGNEVKTAGLTALSDEVLFSHKTHVAQYGLSCAECHGDVASSAAVPAGARVTMAECTRCHEERAGRRDDCAACHRDIRAERAPEDHFRNWRRRHGQIVEAEGGAEAARCTLCHEQELDCTACHRDEAPENHTNYWRQRGHGIVVRMDRSRCSTCHQPDFCDRCHQETAPRSHVASFGSPMDRHCLTCHLPLGTDNCAVCHRATPSHALAAPKPPDHSPGMNCRQCHGLTAPLPHPDKGDDCNTCHR